MIDLCVLYMFGLPHAAFKLVSLGCVVRLPWRSHGPLLLPLAPDAAAPPADAMYFSGPRCMMPVRGFAHRICLECRGVMLSRQGVVVCGRGKRQLDEATRH